MERTIIDLTKKKKTREVTTYLNVYSDGQSYGYSSEADAAAVARRMHQRAAVISIPITIIYEED